MPLPSSEIPFPWLLQFVYWSFMSVSADLGINKLLNLFNIWNTVFFCCNTTCIKSYPSVFGLNKSMIGRQIWIEDDKLCQFKSCHIWRRDIISYIKNRHCNNPACPKDHIDSFLEISVTLSSSLFHIWMFAKQTGRHAKPNHSGNPATITHFDSSAHFGALKMQCRCLWCCQLSDLCQGHKSPLFLRLK